MAEEKLKDPVEQITKQRQAKDAEIGIMDVSDLTEADFIPVPIAAAKSSHPFDGYPIKAKITMGSMGKVTATFEISATYVIALNPKEYVYQDPSGENVTIIDSKTKAEKLVTLATFYSERIRNYEQGGISYDVVFDRTVPLAGGRVMQNCAYVPDASVRAQLMFYYDNKQERTLPNRRFVITDSDQINRLRRLYEMINNPRIKVERLSRAISGETAEDIEGIPE